jgi:uncharacterized protein
MSVQIRDPVHNFISLREKEQRLLATPALQRLRGIRQLALASLVYPGAVHTRFDHTLGVMHVAGQMAKALRLDEDDIETVRLAALLHDIGHGPFSHVSEYVLERYADRSKLKVDQKKEKIHELVTGLMVTNDSGITDALGKQTCDKIAQLLATGHGERVLRQIVTGPLDADKQDYLLRDSYFCGVQYGVFDHHQLHRSLVNVRKADQLDHELMIRPDGIHAVEQYVLAKYYLTTNVYRHKVRLITDQMIVRAIVLGIEKDAIASLGKLYRFDNTPTFASRYAGWDDARFLQELGRRKTDGKCKDLMNRLNVRRLFKRVFAGRPSDFRAEVKELLLGLVKQDRDPQVQKQRDSQRSSVEAAIADVIGTVMDQNIDPDYLIFHAFDIKSVKEMSRNDEASILVDKKPDPIPFEQASALFESINESFNEEFIEVYAPVNWNNHTERDKHTDRLREKIIDAIQQHITPLAEGATS